MITFDQFANYIELLKIRQSARRRDVTIIGAIFLISFICMIGIGLVSGLNSREVYLVAAMNVAFGIGFVMAWVKLEIVKGNIELMNNLHVRDR